MHRESRLIRLPDFFIIGAAKSGTTSLYALLEQHPQIFMPSKKEPEFFARDDLYSEGIESYAAAFSAAGPNQMVGEASTIYTLSPFFPDTARRIREHAPDARLIYIMREPVARAYSYYVQLVKNYQNTTGDYAIHRTFEDFVLPGRHARAAPRACAIAPFDAHLPDDPELCLAGSDYLFQINRYLECFPRERFLFLKYEDFSRNEEATLGQITDFLDLPPLPRSVLNGNLKRQNVSSTHFVEVSGIQRINNLARQAGPLWKFRWQLPDRIRLGLRQRFLERSTQSVAQHDSPPPIIAETHRHLTSRFEANFDVLSELTGLDLTAWRER